MSLLRPRLVGLVLSLVLLAGSAATFILGRPVADAYASRAWVTHVAGRATTVGEARLAARRAVSTLQRTAPLPVAGAVTRTTLDVVRQNLAGHPQTALELAAQIRQQIESLQGSWRGWGLRGDLTTARDLEAQARTAAAAATGRRRR